jgi:hypothetical protein
METCAHSPFIQYHPHPFSTTLLCSSVSLSSEIALSALSKTAQIQKPTQARIQVHPYTLVLNNSFHQRIQSDEGLTGNRTLREQNLRSHRRSNQYDIGGKSEW